MRRDNSEIYREFGHFSFDLMERYYQTDTEIYRSVRCQICYDVADKNNNISFDSKLPLIYMYIGPLIDNIFCSWNKLTGQNNKWFLIIWLNLPLTTIDVKNICCTNKMNIHLRTLILKVISLNIVIIQLKKMYKRKKNMMNIKKYVKSNKFVKNIYNN